MSYILDALKKADAERERGSVPGLHSQPQASLTDDDEPLRDTRPLVWVGAGVALTVISLLSWQLWSRGPAAPEPVPASDDVKLAQGQPLGARPSPAAPEGVAPAPRAAPPTQMTAPQATHTPGVPVPPPASPPAAKPPTRQPSETATSDAAGKASREARGTASATGHASSKDASEPANSQAQAPVPTLSELPEEVRRELPQMVVGGAMYSDTPSTRMLVINSQVLHEGDQAAPGVVLQEIRLKSAVFNYRGLRYSIAY
jgi:general secretion pathway protein B